jgi:hypothetical protein
MKEVSDMEEGGEKKKPWLQRTKEGGVKKIPKEVQKRRRNYRLKKMLTPKVFSFMVDVDVNVCRQLL